MAATGSLAPSRAMWRKSSYSANGGNCVEVAAPGAGPAGRVIAVRDSQDPDGAALVVAARAWRAFTVRVKGGPPALAWPLRGTGPAPAA